MKNPPAFQFYPSDFLSDQNVEVMTNQELGCYIRLLCSCWIQGSLPSEVPLLARICRETDARMGKIWPALAPCFRETGDELVHPPLKEALDRYHETNRKKAKARRRRWQGPLDLPVLGNGAAACPLEKFFSPPEYESEHGHRLSKLRRIRVRNARRRGGLPFSPQEWEALVLEFEHRCVRCAVHTVSLQRDHIVPVSVGGCDCVHNIQPLCQKCNTQKGPETTNWKEYRRTHGFSETEATQ